jgi:hypothetical protein
MSKPLGGICKSEGALFIQVKVKGPTQSPLKRQRNKRSDSNFNGFLGPQESPLTMPLVGSYDRGDEIVTLSIKAAGLASMLESPVNPDHPG